MFGKKKVVLEKKENTMLELSRAEILDRFRKSLAEGNILLGVGAGTDTVAPAAMVGVDDGECPLVLPPRLSSTTAMPSPATTTVVATAIVAGSAHDWRCFPGPT